MVADRIGKKSINVIFCLFLRYTSNSDYLTTDDLLLFLEAEQGVGQY